MASMSFQNETERGNECRERRSVAMGGDCPCLNKAIEHHRAAYKTAYMNNSLGERVEAAHNLAIDCRLAGRNNEASFYFKEAFGLARQSNNLVKQGAVLRDWAMLELKEDDIDTAYTLISRSLVILEALPEKTEYAAALGFKARILLANNEYGLGIYCFAEADRILRDKHDIYERNNLRHWLMVQPWRILRWVRLVRLEFLIRTGRHDGK